MKIFKQAALSLVAFVFVFGGTLMLQLEHVDSAPKANQKDYIVVFKDSIGTKVNDTAESVTRANGIVKKHTFSKVMKGFSGTIPEARLNAVKNDPRVAYVTEDKTVSAAAQTNPSGIKRVNSLPSQSSNRGTGVGVAVLDTGIDLTHPDLVANIAANKNCVSPSLNANDDNGHGTHVAGTIAARHNTIGVVGAASEAKLIAVKVLDASGNGTWSQVICGIEWITNNAAAYNIKVANMSLGGAGVSDNNCGQTNGDALHQALCASTWMYGITYITAAGNSSGDTSNFVPAAYDDAVITVSALNDTNGKRGFGGAANIWGADDTYPTFSNYGSAVDFSAPGTDILSTYKSGQYARMSGTSMAAPHVAGIAAKYLKLYPSHYMHQVHDALRSRAEYSSSHHQVTTTHPEPVIWATNL